jgi:hypothetical protein
MGVTAHGGSPLTPFSGAADRRRPTATWSPIQVRTLRVAVLHLGHRSLDRLRVRKCLVPVATGSVVVGIAPAARNGPTTDLGREEPPWRSPESTRLARSQPGPVTVDPEPTAVPFGNHYPRGGLTRCLASKGMLRMQVPLAWVAVLDRTSPGGSCQQFGRHHRRGPTFTGLLPAQSCQFASR